jgi:hypothetical protein
MKGMWLQPAENILARVTERMELVLAKGEIAAVDDPLIFIGEITQLLSTAANRFRKEHCHTAL